MTQPWFSKYPALAYYSVEFAWFFMIQEAMLTTLTAALVLPTRDNKFHLCVCNVGDSLAYVYSKVLISL